LIHILIAKTSGRILITKDTLTMQGKGKARPITGHEDSELKAEA
jgi:hypothetical protein